MKFPKQNFILICPNSNNFFRILLKYFNNPIGPNRISYFFGSSPLYSGNTFPKIKDSNFAPSLSNKHCFLIMEGLNKCAYGLGFEIIIKCKFGDSYIDQLQKRTETTHINKIGILVLLTDAKRSSRQRITSVSL